MRLLDEAIAELLGKRVDELRSAGARVADLERTVEDRQSALVGWARGGLE